jgi:hypothetical protein
VVLLLIAGSALAAPSSFPTPGPQEIGTGPETFPYVDTRSTESQLLEVLDARVTPTELVSLDGPARLDERTDDSLATLSSELTPNPLVELFAEPSVMPTDSMRIPEVTMPSQAPILVPSLDTVFLGAPELNVLLVLLLAVILYRVGAKSLRFR